MEALLLDEVLAVDAYDKPGTEVIIAVANMAAVTRPRPRASLLRDCRSMSIPFVG
ncbi:hypothetical protein [Nonomuraea sp. NPDC050786]|uniref:hypothetical protein n=1 Tax=Nonomuraea sp. NPDC050786 TaxID=3154840 RepID=UPI0033CDB893